MAGQIKIHCWTSVALVALIALAALATLGSGGTVEAALAADPANAISPMEWHHGGGDPLRHGAQRAMFQALQQLNLSDEQKQQVRDITRNARTQWQARTESQSNDRVALDNPGDPDHAAAVAAAKVRAAQRLQNWSDVQQQVYAVLSSDQQAQLPQVLAQMQSRHSTQHGTQPLPAQGAASS